MSVFRDPRRFVEQLSSETAKADRKIRAINAKVAKRIASFEQHAAALERQVAGFLAGQVSAETVDIEAFKAWAKNGNGAAPGAPLSPADEHPADPEVNGDDE